LAAARTHQLAKYWSGIHKALDFRLRSAKELLRHPASGVNAELYFRQMLTEYLPRRFAVESGFVANAAGELSDFMDVLLVDAVNIAPLSAEPGFKVFPSEAILGAIEITSSPKSKVRRRGFTQPIPKMADDVLKLARLRKIATEREYFLHMPHDDYSSPPTPSFEPLRITYELAPRCFLVTFGDEWAHEETYRESLLQSLKFAKLHSDHVWLNAVLSLKHGMYYFQRYTDFKYERISTNPLLEFFLYVNKAVSGIPTGGIDVGRYRPTTPEVEDESKSSTE
jgi:hypothetical protein